ncbi:energy-coupling factor transport system substrate-specific component [Methanobrevibacter gottschalkii]|uniref:Energy-coupling factor transport system substrate-specific component n=2 Tax=Methanobrevibacter gottschalkii TaxID=190974 RepID=A0A3N5B2K5_9EURY|nr:MULTISPECIES: MptD family putative ECF transporter S component [Methanobrevibacter]OEC98527.1 MFS transporter permease [Methanobrevibacter sp. A27]RPF51507.1 energy-coupling factor transport system substrate-specific component [Methanobrevibacter gottschalkii DSM 11977]SEK69334.1 energy-coupling factor transport system substrate-specific component [Methanobrevibacter gottschalkii]
MSEILNVKDLITVGIFSVIMVVLIFLFGMLGYIPILMLALPIIAALICGVPYMLFLTRVTKFGMVTLLGLVLGIVMFLSGHTWVPIVIFTLFAFVADCILKMGDYSSVKNSIISYSCFIVGIMGNMLPFFVLRDYFIGSIRNSMGNDYVNVIAPFLNYEVFIILVILTFIFGLISAYLGKIVLKKHFERAGIA